ncbi:MAG TPA: hypothetical protein VNU45_01355 [Rummeliibacillus sp.]|nr:hypothetical protein [Rummeliibacillus sp.]
MASLPLRLQKKYEILSFNIIDLLVIEPNPNMNGYELNNKLETSRNETSNVFVLIHCDIRFQPESR